MKDPSRIKQELLEANVLLKQRIQKLEQAESELKRAEEALKKSEERYRSLSENSPSMIYLLDLEGNVLVVNEMGAAQFGVNPDAIIGRNISDLFPKHIAERHKQAIDMIVRDGKLLHSELSESFPTGERWIDARIVPVCDKENGKISAVLGISHDITDRKQAEESLRESEKTARRLAQENELVAEVGRIIGSTLSIEEVYGRFAEKVREAIPFDGITINLINTRDNTRTVQYHSGIHIQGRKIGDVVPLDASISERIVRTRSSLLINEKDDAELLRQYPGISLSIAAGIKSRMLIPLISKDEVIGTLLFRSVKPDTYTERGLLLAERVGSQIAGAIANAQLFLERKQAEAQLQLQELQLHTILESTGDGILAVDNAGKVIKANQKFADLWRIPSDLLEKGNDEVLLTYVMGQLVDPYAFLKKVQSLYKSTTVDFDTILFKDGRIMERYSCPLLSKGVINGRVWSFRDITDRKRVEEERVALLERLNRSEKMEALGQLAGGVAHDLNNVLGVLSGYSELLMERIPEDNPLREYAANILKSSEKGAAIIQDLLTLARRGVVASKVVDFNRIVSNLLTTPEFDRLQEYHPRVTIKTNLKKDLLNIKGSPVHLEKTVMNLVSNAAEAIVGSGEVGIRTENRYLDKAVRGYDKVDEGDYVVLMVSDTGRGIPAVDFDKIFEPFYTKKKMGRSGTGLGLAIVWGTVKDHNGYIDVQSIEGRGTTFMLYFPVTREKMDEEVRKIPVEQYLGHGESVLVVDDVEGQRMLVTRMLTSLGYHVNAASSGEEAVEYLKGNKADILVLDMIMEPGIDGLETFQRILAINPYQKAIIVSGFSETERMRKAQELGAGAYVKKPYLMEKIGVAIRDELDRQ